MRASIEASCRRVPERELDYWLALSVFRGPFDRVAASRVTGGRGPLLTSLVDRSLVAAGPSGSYSLLPLLRTYAAERLAEDEGRLAALNWRHAEYFFDLVEQVREPMGYERPAAVRALTVGLDDVRAALLWVVETLFIPGAERRATSQQVAGWCAALMQVCEDNAWFGHAADTFGQVSDALARGGSSALRGATLAYRGWHLLRQSRPTEADAAAVYALELLTGEPGTAAFRTALQVRAGVALHEGRFADSVELFSRALDSARAVTPLTVTAKREVARVTGNLGVAKQLLGDRHGAVRDFWRQLAILRGTGDLAASAAVYSNLGNVLRLLKRGDEAYDALQAALRLATGFDQFALLPSLNVNLGVLYRERGEIEEARRHFEAAASLAEGQGRRALVVTATFQLGRLDLLGGELVEARRAFAAAHDLASETGGVSGALDALAGLAWVAFFEGDMAAAVEMAATVSSNLATSPGTRHWMEELKAVLPSDGGTTVPATRSRRVVTTMRA
jgi:tetratricopeptide (TPR) repeat protein